MGYEPTWYQGCLLGLAAGDAMGCAVDAKSLDEIRSDYGPNGLMGYDDANSRSHITSHTQIAAFVVNGLLAGATREKARGRTALRYAAAALREWAVSQRTYSPPEKTLCWVTRLAALRGHDCMDIRALWVLTRENPGPPSSDLARIDSPSALLAAIGLGLFMTEQEILDTASGMLRLSHCDPSCFFSAAALSVLVCRSLRQPQAPLADLALGAVDAVATVFPAAQTAQLRLSLETAIGLARTGTLCPGSAMEQLRCDSSSQILAGALYACLSSGEDFDGTLVTAVNHSGRSAAVAAVAGALTGLRRGDGAILGFYRDTLEPAWVLDALGEDLARGCPRVFDDDWNEKYRRGRPVEPGGWATV